MPADFEIRERRRAAIVEILQEELVRNQQQLVELLKKKGIVAAQSSVSRDLRDMGVVRSTASTCSGSSRRSTSWTSAARSATSGW